MFRAFEYVAARVAENETEQAHRPTRALRGVLLFACATVMFACLDATSKHLSETWPIGLVAWCRYVVHFVAMTAILAPRMGRALVVTGRPIAQSVRGLLLVSITLLMIAAFHRMPLTEATAVIFASPVLVTLLAGPLLGEKIGPIRWAAALVGFAGVWVLTRPGAGLDAVGTLFALAAAVAYAAYQISTRALSRTESPITLLYYTALAGTVTLTLALPFLGEPHMPTPLEALELCSLGAFGATGHFLLTLAFREAPASLLSPLVYVQLIWASIIGYVVFGQVPCADGLLGTGIIASAGLLLAWDARRPAEPAR